MVRVLLIVMFFVAINAQAARPSGMPEGHPFATPQDWGQVPRNSYEIAKKWDDLSPEEKKRVKEAREKYERMPDDRKEKLRQKWEKMPKKEKEKYKLERKYR